MLMHMLRCECECLCWGCEYGCVGRMSEGECKFCESECVCVCVCVFVCVYVCVCV